MRILDRQVLFFFAVCSAAFFWLQGCAPETQMGSAQVGVSIQGLSSQDVVRVTVRVTGPNITSMVTQDLVKTSNQWQGLIALPAGGNRTFSAEAYNSAGVPVYQGAATGITVTPGGSPTIVTLLLQQVTPPTPFQNAIPTINFFTASKANVANDETIQLAAGASDVDGDPLTYTWSAPQGTFPSGNTGTSITWKSPAATFTGNVVLTLVVTDGHGGQTGTSLTIHVQPHFALGQAQVNITFNTWPLVTQMTSSNDPVNTNQSTTLQVTANDPDGDPLTYAWTALGSGCQAGSFSNTNTANPVWTAPGTTPAGGTCKLLVTISDGNGGQTTGALILNVGPPAAPNLPPQILNAFQSTATVNIGSTVTFRVVAADPEGTAITFSWSDSNGGIGTGITNTGSGPYQSELVWTQPAGSCPQSITVHAADATGQVASYTFQVNQGLTSCGTPPGPYTTRLALGTTHTCALQSDGTVKCAGADGLGQLGNGSQPPFILSTTPITVPGLANITQLASNGTFRTCALDANQVVQCWGNNSQGEFGTTSPQSHTSPFTIPGLASTTQIALGSLHNCAVTSSATVQCWGNNASGKIDYNNTATLLPATTISGLSNVTQIAPGGTFSCALLSGGTVQCWGFNTSGALGDGTSNNSATPVAVSGLSGVTQITSSLNHSCALLGTGEIRCWGTNSTGQLGDGTTTDRLTPVAVVGITNATKVRSGGGYTCALLGSGTGASVKCWGFNIAGQLGNGNTTNQLLPTTVLGLNNPVDIAVGSRHACVLQANNTVRCWGSNSHGQLADGTTNDQLIAITTQF